MKKKKFTRTSPLFLNNNILDLSTYNTHNKLSNFTNYDCSNMSYSFNFIRKQKTKWLLEINKNLSLSQAIFISFLKKLVKKNFCYFFFIFRI